MLYYCKCLYSKCRNVILCKQGTCWFSLSFGPLVRLPVASWSPPGWYHRQNAYSPWTPQLLLYVPCLITSSVYEENNSAGGQVFTHGQVYGAPTVQFTLCVSVDHASKHRTISVPGWAWFKEVSDTKRHAYYSNIVASWPVPFVALFLWYVPTMVLSPMSLWWFCTYSVAIACPQG